MKPKTFRLLLVLSSLVFACAAVLLVLQGMKEGIVYFYSPTDVQNPVKVRALIEKKTPVRMGGLVQKNSLQQKDDVYHFMITDTHHAVAVEYTGLLPALFREEQGVIAEGILKDAPLRLISQRVLAKHDEKYMPREVYKALRDAAAKKEKNDAP